MEYTFPNELIAESDTRAGRMFSAGDIRVTVTSPRSKGGEHITIRFKAIRDNRDGEGRNWLRVPLNEATHVFIEVPNANSEWPDKVGVFYPRTGKFFVDDNADPARVTAAVLAATWLNEGDQRRDKLGGYKLQEESHCGVCGLRLTDPESIDLGIGPECNRKQTSSQHQIKVKQKSLHTVMELQFTADQIIDLIMDMPDSEVERIREELNMWHSADSQSTLFER